MKNSEIKALTLEELEGKLLNERENYSKLKFAHAITPIENPMRIKVSRRLIARLHTELSNKKNQQAD